MMPRQPLGKDSPYKLTGHLSGDESEAEDSRKLTIRNHGLFYFFEIFTFLHIWIYENARSIFQTKYSQKRDTERSPFF